MANTEILAAIRALQTNFEVQLHATNKTIYDLHKSVDLWFDALQAGPLPARSGSPTEALAPASSQAFRSDGSSSVPQQRRGLHLLSFDITSAAATISIAAATTSAAASTSIAAATTSAAVSTSFSAAPPPSTSPAPSPSAVVSPPSPPSSAASKTVEVSISRSPAAAMSAESLSICGVLSETKRIINAPSPAPLPPTRDVTPPPNFQFGPQPPPSPPQAHITWFSPLDMEAQSNPFNKFQDDVAVASRRGVIFSLYALEEVYKDIFESPP